MVVAVYTASYTNRFPYLTVAEYQAAPTAIDTNNLVQGGSPTQQLAALAEVIGRASSWVDTYCCGAQGTLCATVNTEVGRVGSDRTGRWIIHPRYWPILEVTAVSIGADPAFLAPITLTAANCWIEEQQFMVTSGMGLTSTAGPLEFAAPARPGREAFAQWSYVNGWPNTILGAAANAADTAIIPASVVGIYPGSSFTIYDAPNDETVTVSSSYVAGAASVPLASPLVSQHAKGVSVTALPPAVKQAAVFLVTALIKTRGDNALTLEDLNEPKEKATSEMVSAGDQAIAAELLDPFRVIWGQR